MNPYRSTISLLVLPLTIQAFSCGGDGGSTASDSQGNTVTATTPPMTDPTSDTTPTSTMQTPTGSGTTDADTGTAGNSAGETTTGTTGPVGTTTTGVSATDTGTGTTGPVGTSTTTQTGTSGDDTTTTTGDTGNCQPGDTQGMGDVEKSYLWVANSDEGSVSKVDTQKLLEIARYRTGPGGGGYAENPSRTAVSLDGRFVIVNGRQSGRSTVIAANIDDCVDKNGNGKIETSQNKSDLLAWDADECKLWSIVHPIQVGNIGAGPRGVTWTPGTWDMDACAFKNPKVWVGYLPAQPGIAHVVRLDGATGAVEETVVVNNWSQGWTDYGPYGAALDKDKNVWFTGLRGELFRINTANNPATFDRWTPPPGTESYGMTVDPDGDAWMAGCSGPVTTYEPKLNKFTAVAGTSACYRGIAADHDGSVWVAENGVCGITQIDHKTNQLIKFHPTNPCGTPVGVSVDLEGFVWLVDESGWAWKIDPANPGGMQKVDIIGDHYTYSDMTGGQLKSVILPQ